MKKTLALLLISLPLSSIAFDQNSHEQELKSMVEGLTVYMNKIKVCQEKVDPKKLEEFQKKSEINDAEIEALCLTNRDKAEELSNSFMSNVMQDPELKEMMDCITTSLGEDSSADDDSEDTSHECD